MQLLTTALNSCMLACRHTFTLKLPPPEAVQCSAHVNSMIIEGGTIRSCQSPHLTATTTTTTLLTSTAQGWRTHKYTSGWQCLATSPHDHTLHFEFCTSLHALLHITSLQHTMSHMYYCAELLLHEPVCIIMCSNSIAISQASLQTLSESGLKQIAAISNLASLIVFKQASKAIELLGASSLDRPLHEICMQGTHCMACQNRAT